MIQVMTLEELDAELFQHSSKALSPEKRKFLEQKWDRIREMAVQNSGFGTWGPHLLKLSGEEISRLKAKFLETIQSVEHGHLHLEEEFIQKHPELIGLRFLLDPTSEVFIELFDRDNAKAIFWEYDSSLVARHRAHFQEVFKFLYRHPAWARRDKLVCEMLVGHLIAILPYFDFENTSKIEILRFLDNSWKLVAYQVNHIPMIDGEIYAYGLEPQDEPRAKPILIFRGTPYPAARGFLEAIWSDLHPIKSIGEEIFEKGSHALDLWMQGKEDVDCYGLSLGGAIAYHAGQVYGKRLNVYAYAAPGLIPMKGGLTNIHGRVFFHYNDLIKSIGYHPESEHFKVYAVITDLDLNLWTAHSRPTGLGPTLVLKVDPTNENRTWTRYFANILKVAVSTLLFLILFPIKKIVDLFRQ